MTTFGRLALVLALFASAGAAADYEYRAIDEYIVRHEYRKAETMLRTLAADGETEAMYRLAGLYRSGQGFPRRLDESARLYLAAAERGHVPSMFLAGQCFERGIGVASDVAKARAWYARAAEAGDARAQARLDAVVDTTTDLFVAVAAAGDSPAVLARLESADLDAVDARGRTLLMVAASSNAAKAVAVLLARGAAPDAGVDRAGRTALFHAIDADSVAIVDALLERGADPNRVDAAGNAPLHLAAAAGRLPIVESLLAAGARADARNAGEWTAYDLALNKSHAQVARRLEGSTPKRMLAAARGADAQLGLLRRASQFEGMSDLAIAVWQGDAAVVAQLLAENAADPPGHDGHTSLYWAVERGHAAILSALLRAGKDPSVDRSPQGSLLHVALSHDRAEMIPVLLDAGIDETLVDERRATALLFAIDQGARDAALALAHAGAPLDRPDADGRTPLIAAADAGDLELLERLLSLGAGVAAFDRHERSALWYAAAAEDTSLVTRLLAAGAGFDADAEGVAPLHRAIATGRTQAVDALLAAGHPVDLRTHSGSSALLLAASRDDAVVVSALLAHGADANQRDATGDTPLHKAAALGHLDVARVLLEHGAKPGIRNDRDENFFDIAERRHDALWTALADGHRSELSRLIGG